MLLHHRLCTVSKISEGELVRMRKEAVVPEFEVLSRKFWGELRKTTERNRIIIVLVWI
jgi:hypothetical protein